MGVGSESDISRGSGAIAFPLLALSGPGFPPAIFPFPVPPASYSVSLLLILGLSPVNRPSGLVWDFVSAMWVSRDEFRSTEAIPPGLLFLLSALSRRMLLLLATRPSCPAWLGLLARTGPAAAQRLLPEPTCRRR